MKINLLFLDCKGMYTTLEGQNDKLEEQTFWELNQAYLHQSVGDPFVFDWNLSMKYIHKTFFWEVSNKPFNNSYY